MSKPIYRDPLFDGATDPTVVRRSGTDEWWMFYTQRRTTDSGSGVRWVHGTRIGIARSIDGGLSWEYQGEARGLGHADDTLWAPEVIAYDGGYRMYLTVVDGVHTSWAGAAHIEEYRSEDLLSWSPCQRLDLGSDRVIDAAVARCGDGRWRLWYKNERDASTTWAAVSDDLDRWQVEGRVVGEPSHEGPNVFVLGGCYWMITDEWRGLAVHRSTDGVRWVRQQYADGLILNLPGSDPLDRALGHHADVVVQPDGRGGERGLVFYFTHPHRIDGVATQQGRHSPIHVAELTLRDGDLVADRDVPIDQPLLIGGVSGHAC